MLIASPFPSGGKGGTEMWLLGDPCYGEVMASAHGSCHRTWNNFSDCHLHPAPTALRSLGLSKGRNLLDPEMGAENPMKAALCDSLVSASTARGSFAIRRKHSSSLTTLPKRQLPLRLQFKNSFPPGERRIQGLLNPVLGTLVLVSSAPLISSVSQLWSKPVPRACIGYL